MCDLSLQFTLSAISCSLIAGAKHSLSLNIMLGNSLLFISFGPTAACLAWKLEMQEGGDNRAAGWKPGSVQ